MNVGFICGVAALLIAHCESQDEQCLAVGGKCIKGRRCRGGWRPGSRLGGRCVGRRKKCCVPLITTTTTTTTTTPEPTTTSTPSCEHQLDVVFVLEASSSVSFPELGHAKDFILKSAESLGLAAGGVHSGVVFFSGSAVVVTPLGEDNDLDVFSNAVVNAVRPPAGSGLVPDLAVFQALQLFAQEGRIGVPKVLIYVTDSALQGELVATEEAINQVKALDGAKVIAVPVKSSATSFQNRQETMIAQARVFASEPTDENALVAESFSALADSSNLIVAETACRIDCGQYNGECVEMENRKCPKGWVNSGAPRGICQGEAKKCCVNNPTRDCTEVGGQCFEGSCPDSFRSVSAGEPMKCVGRNMKCCKALTVVTIER